MSNLLSEHERQTLSEVLKRHLNNLEGVEVILFGSMANGKPRPTSDIDIAIRHSKPLDKSTWAKIESDFAESSIGRKVDVVDYARV